MEKAICGTCLTAPTTLKCGLCDEPSCKACSQFLDDDAFSFLPKISDDLKKGTYCLSCFETKVSEELESYESTMERAKQVDVYFRDQGKETRLIPRAKNIKYEIASCEDRDELILRFAFLAATDGYSTLVDVDIIGDKVRHQSFQTTNYRGTAVPANAKPAHIPKDRSLRHNPN